MGTTVTVGISDMKIIKDTGTLITYALGSCIGICLYDSALKLAGMIHIMLPEAPATGADKVFKYADTGIRETIKKMESMGSNRMRLTAKIAGGAKMFDIPGDGALGNIGDRNIIAVKNVLRIENIKILKEEVGFNFARTLSMEAQTGLCRIKAFGHPDKII